MPCQAVSLSSFSSLPFPLSLPFSSLPLLEENNYRLFMMHWGWTMELISLLKRPHIQPVWTAPFKDRLWENVKNSDSLDSYYCNLWRADEDTIILSPIKPQLNNSFWNLSKWHIHCVHIHMCNRACTCGYAHRQKHTPMLHLCTQICSNTEAFLFSPQHTTKKGKLDVDTLTASHTHCTWGDYKPVCGQLSLCESRVPGVYRCGQWWSEASEGGFVPAEWLLLMEDKASLSGWRRAH